MVANQTTKPLNAAWDYNTHRYLLGIVICGWLFPQQPSIYTTTDCYNDCVLLEHKISKNPELYFNTPRSGQLHYVLMGSKTLFSQVQVRDVNLIRQSLIRLSKESEKKYYTREKLKKPSSVKRFYFSSDLP